MKHTPFLYFEKIYKKTLLVFKKERGENMHYQQIRRSRYEAHFGIASSSDGKSLVVVLKRTSSE